MGVLVMQGCIISSWNHDSIMNIDAWNAFILVRNPKINWIIGIEPISQHHECWILPLNEVFWGYFSDSMILQHYICEFRINTHIHMCDPHVHTYLQQHICDCSTIFVHQVMSHIMWYMISVIWCDDITHYHVLYNNITHIII